LQEGEGVVVRHVVDAGDHHGGHRGEAADEEQPAAGRGRSGQHDDEGGAASGRSEEGHQQRGSAGLGR